MKAIVECIWFALTVMCALIAIKELLRHNISQGLMFIALGLIALLFFFFRRRQRRSLEE
jgi:LPXTG-motif cell wall-anchored protein